MDQNTLNEILGAKTLPTHTPHSRDFSSMLPTGEGSFEQILDILGLRDSYEQLLEALRLSSSVTFYLFAVIAFFTVFFALRAWRINSYAREKRRQQLQRSHHAY